MQKLFKWLATSLLSMLILLILAVVYVSVAIDPNQYRGNIEAIAEQNGLQLSLEGDLKWQLLPLGIRFNQVNFTLHDQSMAGSIEQLWLGVNPLSASIKQNTNAQLPVSSFKVDNARLFVSRPDQLPLQINAIDFEASDIAFDGTAFPISLSLQPLPGIQLFLDTQLGIVYSEQKISDFSLSDFSLTLGELKVTGEIDTSNQMAYIWGSVQTEDIDLPKQVALLQKLASDLYLPEMVDPKALKAVRLSSSFNIEPTQTSEVQVQLVVDAQPIDINILIDEQDYSMTTQVSAQTLDVSAYLFKDTVANNNAALFAPLAVPLALWHGKSQVEVYLGELQWKNFSLENIYLDLFGNRNVFKVNSLTADAFDGQIDAVAELDLRHSEAIFRLQSSIANANLETLVASTDINKASPVEGVINLDINLQGSGNHTQTLVNSLKGSGQLTVSAPLLKDINIEQTLCTAMAMLSGGKQTDQNWAKSTELNDLMANFRFDGGRMTINNFNTGAGNIDLLGEGSVDLFNQTYRLDNKLLIDQAKTSEAGCSVNQKLQNREVIFRCEGRLGDRANCRPDGNLIRLFMQKTAKERLGDRFSQRLSGDDQSNPVKNLIKKRLFSSQ